MKIIVEGQEYEVSKVSSLLKGIIPLDNRGKVKPHFVGYMYNKEADDCVFFLPKVIVRENGMIFERYTAEDIIDIDALTGDKSLTQEERRFLYSFSVWVYQAVNTYNRLNPDNIIVQEKNLSEVDFSTSTVHVTILDNILALIHYAEKNKDFLLFSIRHCNSGYNKINWIQTIGRKQPIMCNGKAPLYLDPINRKKEVDFEEELLVIFFSILHHIENTYGFRTSINENFEYIPSHLFEKYLKGYGRQRLREIKYKYYSDKTLHIWQLCYAFFAMSEKAGSSSASDDYLITTDFDRLFESIIDNLIGQKEADYPAYLKSQKDGKEIDHIFRYESLTDTGQDIYYIGDSKYYKYGDEAHGNSEYKQYTYAKNVIQSNLDLLLRERHGKKVNEKYLIYRDEKTEGYNVTPNFFIYADIDKDFSYVDDKIVHREESDTIKVHFDNRLFDRDTLLLAHYDINFLFVLTMYAGNNDYCKEVYRNKVRQMFREKTLECLNKRYLFYILELRNKPVAGNEQASLMDALNPIFRLVNGKVFCPKQDRSYTNLILALERPEVSEVYKSQIKKENQDVLDSVKKDFKIFDDYKIGSDIPVFLRKKKGNSK